jgi:hypothetical protein
MTLSESNASIACMAVVGATLTSVALITTASALGYSGQSHGCHRAGQMVLPDEIPVFKSQHVLSDCHSVKNFDRDQPTLETAVSANRTWE